MPTQAVEHKPAVVAHGYVFSAKRFREMRQMRRLSYGALSMRLFRYERVRISYEALRRYELGKRKPSFDLVVSIAAILHCDVVRLCAAKRNRAVTIERTGLPGVYQ